MKGKYKFTYMEKESHRAIKLLALQTECKSMIEFLRRVSKIEPKILKELFNKQA